MHALSTNSKTALLFVRGKKIIIISSHPNDDDVTVSLQVGQEFRYVQDLYTYRNRWEYVLLRLQIYTGIHFLSFFLIVALYACNHKPYFLRPKYI